MKKFFIPTILLLLSCSSGEELPEPIEKITDSELRNIIKNMILTVHTLLSLLSFFNYAFL